MFEFFPPHPELSDVFNNAMTNVSAHVIPAALEAYDFSGISSVVDGRVILLEAVLTPANHPDFGKLLDLEMSCCRVGASGRKQSSAHCSRRLVSR